MRHNTLVARILRCGGPEPSLCLSLLDPTWRAWFLLMQIRAREPRDWLFVTEVPYPVMLETHPDHPGLVVRWRVACRKYFPEYL